MNLHHHLPHAKAAEAIAPFKVMAILQEAQALAKSGEDIIAMHVGEPDFPSLPQVHQAVKQAIDAGLTGYTPATGLPALRQKLVDFYAHFYGAQVPYEQIMLTPGASGALQLALTAVLNPGDRVLLTDPAYPCNRQFVQLLGARVEAIAVDAEENFQLSLARLQAVWHSGVKLVMVASPANPTGTVIEQAELVAMAQWCAQRQCYFLVDEIYQGLVYDRPAQSLLATPGLVELGNVMVINSFSKYFGMTGWRLGWLVAPLHLMGVLDRLAQNLFLAPPTPAQYGALRVLDKDVLVELEARRQIFAQRRDALYHAMIAAGFTIPLLPQGAFYLYWDVSQLTHNAEDLAHRCLHQAGVAVTPGSDFGVYRAHEFIRLAYTTDISRLLAAVQRLQQLG